MARDFTIVRESIDDEKFEIDSIKKDKFLHVGVYIYSLSKLYMYDEIW